MLIKQIKRVIITILLVVVAAVGVFYIKNYLDKKPKTVNALTYFIQNTRIEPQGLPWGSGTSEAFQYFKTMDESYDRYVSNMQRLIPKRQLYFRDLNLTTESMRIVYSTDEKQIEVDYVFRFNNQEESWKAYEATVNYLLNHFPKEFQNKVVDNGVKVKNQAGELVSNPEYRWMDDQGNVMQLVNFSYREESPHIAIFLYSSDF